MIIMKLEGGLGNQMFQYSLGRNLSLIHNAQLKIDSSYLKKDNQSKRTLGINNFNTILAEATGIEVSSYNSIFQKILDRLRKTKKKIIEKSNIFDPNILLIKDGYFCGHWNNENYFKKNEETIRNDFKLNKPFSEEAAVIANTINSSPNSTSMHIRRGDYVSIKKIADKHGVLPILYYEKAMTQILEKFPNSTFFIFSDDINWAINNLPKKYPIIFVSSFKIPDYEELTLMSLCKNNITANSTFSWWGAWLNNNSDKIVITPQKWFVDKKLPDNFLPANWQKM